MMKLAIGIPLSFPFCHSDFFDSWTLMHKHSAEVIRVTSGSIDTMRNAIVKSALAKDCTHLMFLDTDMIYPPDTITKLLANDEDICGGLTFKRWPPFTPLVMVGEKHNLQILYPYPDDELVKVTATGTGCLMVKMDVFKKMPYPWFEFKKKANGETVGEDIGFCYKAAELGYDIFVDTSIRTLHIVMMGVDDNFYRLNLALKESGKSIDFHGKEVENPWEP